MKVRELIIKLLEEGMEHEVYLENGRPVKGLAMSYEDGDMTLGDTVVVSSMTQEQELEEALIGEEMYRGSLEALKVRIKELEDELEAMAMYPG